MDRGVIATATELFEGRHFPSVVAMCSDALEDEPECVPLLLMRARAHIALRRDLDAQADLRDIIRLEPQCAPAYRLLGELAARRDENESAAIFFREALRLDPADVAAADWLLVVDAALRPAPAIGRIRTERRAVPQPPPRFARGTRTPDDDATDDDDDDDDADADAGRETQLARQRFARELHAGHDGPTQRYGRAVPANHGVWKTPAPQVLAGPPLPADSDAADLAALETVIADLARGSEPAIEDVGTAPPHAQTVLAQPGKPGAVRTMQGRALAPEPAKPAPPFLSEPTPPIRRSAPKLTRSPIPELPGFGEYLVTTGILTRERLRAAQAYQRSMKVQLATAIVTLGLATPQRIEWAAVAHQSQLSRDRQG